MGTGIKDLRDEAAAWCRGKNGFVRWPLLGGFAYVLVRSLANPMYRSILAPVNLGFHEIGHLLFSYGGRSLGMSGGTFLECLAPVLGMIHLYRQRDFFAVALCFGWLSTAFFSVATYAGDARNMAMPLVSLSWGDTVTHDWNYMLSRMGLLQYDFAVAFLFRALAVVSMLMCLGAGVWLLRRMKADRTDPV